MKKQHRFEEDTTPYGNNTFVHVQHGYDDRIFCADYQKDGNKNK